MTLFPRTERQVDCMNTIEHNQGAAMKNEATQYPFEEGDTIVLGPEIFAAKDRSVICWQGENYVPQPEPSATPDDGGS